MQEHIRVGREYPDIDLNTSYSFGLDDQEFVVAFETDDPARFLDLVQRLRTTEASAYTKRDTPTFTCVSTSVERALSALDGAPLARRPRHDHRMSSTTPSTSPSSAPARSGSRPPSGPGCAQASSRIIDSLPELGGQCTTLYPEKWIFDVPGHPQMLAKRPRRAAARAGARAVRRPGPPRDAPPRGSPRTDDEVVLHTDRRRPALAHGDRRRRPRRVRAQEAAALRRRHEPVGGPRRALPRRRQAGVRRQARRDRRRRRLAPSTGSSTCSRRPPRSRSCTAATASAPTRRPSPR